MLIYCVFSLTLIARLLFCNLVYTFVCLNKWKFQIGHHVIYCHNYCNFIRNISNQKLVYIISYFIDVEIKGIKSEHDIKKFCCNCLLRSWFVYARRVVKFHSHWWSRITEALHVKAHVKPHVKCMWNNVWITGCFAIQWGLSTCESLCETPCEVYENMCEFKWGLTCESLCETPCEVYVKICVKGMTSLHTLFTYISLCDPIWENRA